MRRLVQGDGGSALLVTILDAAGDPLDLSSKTATLAFSIADGPVRYKTMAILSQVTNKGQCQYTFTSADLDTAGELEGEVVLNRTLVDQLTSDKFRVPVREPVMAGV